MQRNRQHLTQILDSENSDSRPEQTPQQEKLFQQRVLVNQLQEVIVYLYHLTSYMLIPTGILKDS